MDIQAQGEPARKAFEQQQRALIESNRALVRAAREDLKAVAAERHAKVREARDVAAREVEQRSERRDAIELSKAAVSSSEVAAEREARVRELAEAHRMEQLHTPERIERAAQRLLED